jgi:hypothetical protein
VPSSSKNNYQGTCALISQKRIRGHKKIFFRGILSGESFSREKKSEAAVAVVAKFFGGGPENAELNANPSFPYKILMLISRKPLPNTNMRSTSSRGFTFNYERFTFKGLISPEVFRITGVKKPRKFDGFPKSTQCNFSKDEFSILSSP